jgi:hypothetical protein
MRHEKDLFPVPEQAPGADTRYPFGLLDGDEVDLGLIAETVFIAGGGNLDPELNDLLESIGSRILILNG